MNEIIIGDFAWLRNDYISDEDELLIDGISYPSVEHAFQAAKFSDRHIKVCIADAETVEEARIISRRTPGVRSDWDQVRDRVMESLIRQKFVQSNFLATKLARTGSSKITMKGYDSFWGTGKDGKGEDILGCILNRVRSDIQAITGIKGDDPVETHQKLKTILKNEPSEDIIKACQRLYDVSVILSKVTCMDNNEVNNNWHGAVNSLTNLIEEGFSKEEDILYVF